MSTFDDRLDEALDDVNRRDFLKKTAIGVAAVKHGKLPAIAPVSKAQDAIPVRRSARDTAHAFIEASAAAWKGSLGTTGADATPQEVTKYLHDLFAGKGPPGESIGNWIAVADDAGWLDEYTGGGYQKALESYVARVGHTGALKALSQYWADDLPISVHPELAASDILELIERIPSFASVMPKNIINYGHETGDFRHFIDRLKKIGVVDPNEADKAIRKETEWIDGHRPRTKEKIIPRPDDHIYGSPMHQPFEDRLSNALSEMI